MYGNIWKAPHVDINVDIDYANISVKISEYYERL